jgi:hypothetical protein
MTARRPDGVGSMKNYRSSDSFEITLKDPRSWHDQGVVVPNGSLARMEYARGLQIYDGQFLDGKLVVNGCEYRSLSAAAIAVAVTRHGQRTILNGWLYWKVQFPGEALWRSLEDMRLGRKRYRIM